MSSPKRNRARILTASGLKKLREQLRSHEADHNNGVKYSLEKLGELTGLDPETVKNVRDGKKADKLSIARCFETFGLTLAESDHIPAAQATATADPNFVGRDEAIADLNTLVSRNARVIVIQARGGVGKTTLARKYLQQEFGSFLEFPIAKETKDIASIEGLLEEKLRQLGEEPGREFLVSLDRLKRKLQAERIGVLIDNLEPALDSAGKFIEAHRRYVELLRVLSDSTVQSLTLITSRERLREADVTVQHYPLRSLDVQAWLQFFQSRNINTDTPTLAALQDAYGGNAKAMDIISGVILEDFSGNVEAYWQANQDDLFIERDLEDLVIKQFNRLQELDSDAYKLLCRIGCYRYQDVPTVSIEGLFCLLWDVPETRHRRVIKSLQDRSLVDCDGGGYWLHPIIRAEAIIRLKSTSDWAEAHCKSAVFWTESVQVINTLEDALKAFEAYYHYLEVPDFNSACTVIITEKKNRWFTREEEGETLGWSFYRFGLFEKNISAMDFIVKNIEVGYPLSKLNNLLGVMYWAMGDIHKAISYNNTSNKIRGEIERFNLSPEDNLKLDIIEINYFINLGLCKINLWELEQAEKLFKSAIMCSKNRRLDYYNLIAEAYLIFPAAFLSPQQLIRELAEALYSKISLVGWGTRGRGYSLLFLAVAYKNLGEFNRAFELYQAARCYAEESQYAQVKAKSLIGLAELNRKIGNFSKAFSIHFEAMELLTHIRAISDLAESYFQLALTHQAAGDIEGKNKNFHEAIRLFSEMEAPRQVERVRQSVQN